MNLIYDTSMTEEQARLKSLKLVHKLTWNQIAAILGVSVHTVKAWSLPDKSAAARSPGPCCVELLELKLQTLHGDKHLHTQDTPTNYTADEPDHRITLKASLNNGVYLADSIDDTCTTLDQETFYTSLDSLGAGTVICAEVDAEMYSKIDSDYGIN